MPQTFNKIQIPIAFNCVTCRWMYHAHTYCSYYITDVLLATGTCRIDSMIIGYTQYHVEWISLLDQSHQVAKNVNILMDRTMMAIWIVPPLLVFDKSQLLYFTSLGIHILDVFHMDVWVDHEGVRCSEKVLFGIATNLLKTRVKHPGQKSLKHPYFENDRWTASIKFFSIVEHC